MIKILPSFHPSRVSCLSVFKVSLKKMLFQVQEGSQTPDQFSKKIMIPRKKAIGENISLRDKNIYLLNEVGTGFEDLCSFLVIFFVHIEL